MRTRRRLPLVVVVTLVAALLLLVLPARIAAAAGPVGPAHPLGVSVPVPGPCPSGPAQCTPATPLVVFTAVLGTGLLVIAVGAVLPVPARRRLRRRRAHPGHGPLGIDPPLLRPPR